MRKDESIDREPLSSLRTDENKPKAVFKAKNFDDIFQELQVHQVELEMQNGELLSINEELEMQRLKFMGMYDLAPVGFFVLSREGLIEEMNMAAVSMVNSGTKTWMGCAFSGLVSASSSTIYEKFYQQLVKTPGKRTCKVKLMSASGQQFYAQLEGVFLDGIGKYFLAVIDITDSILATQELSETRDRLMLALQASATGSWELEPDTMRFSFDEYNYQILDVDRQNFDQTYQSFIELLHPDDRFLVDQAFRKAINTEQEINLNCRFIRSNGNIWHAVVRGHINNKTDGRSSYVGIMMDITEKKLAQEETGRLKEGQEKELLLARFSAEENERKRISEGLHDSVSQLLYGVKIQLGQLNIADQAAVARLNELISVAIQETRNISFELAPSILKDFGLKDTLKELAGRFSTENFQIQTMFRNLNQRLDNVLEITVFRIIQELVNNAMKHSGAALITIDIRKNKKLEIRVKDNGCGFDTRQLDYTTHGAGISSIRNRLIAFNGTMLIDAAPGQGTTVSISIPYKK